MVLNLIFHTFVSGGASVSLQYHQNFELKVALAVMKLYLLDMKTIESAGAFATWLESITFLGTSFLMRILLAISHLFADTQRTMPFSQHLLFFLNLPPLIKTIRTLPISHVGIIERSSLSGLR